jgi:protease-4
MQPTTDPKPVIIDPHPQKTPGKYRRSNLLIWMLSGCIGCVGVSFIILVIFFYSIASIFSAFGSTTLIESIVKDGSGKDKIVIIPINGLIINEGGNSFLNTDTVTTSDSVENLLDIAAVDTTVKAIILRENTPGGDTLAARKICRKIQSIRKPTYTYIETRGASAGYYIASCTKYIIADEQAIVGGIGAIYEAYDTQGLLDKLGIRVKVITNTQGTQKASDLFQNDSKNEKKMKSLLDQVYEDFFNTVSKSRKDKKLDDGTKITDEYLKTLATGEVFSGKDAKKNGLADETGFLDEAIQTLIKREALSSDLRAVQYSYHSFDIPGISPLLKTLSGVSAPNLSITPGSLLLLAEV